ATNPPSAQTNILWDFGNAEAVPGADPNTVNGITGQQVSHRYSGLTTPTQLPVTRTVTAASVTNSSLTGSAVVTLAKPAVSVGVKNYKVLFELSNASSTAPIVAGDQFVDTSDGSVQSHFTGWNIDGTTTKATPAEAVGVGACAPQHTLTMTAHYGYYTGSSPNQVSLSDMPIDISGVKYAVRPFAAAIDVTSTSTDITFNSGSRITADASILSAAQIAALQYKWDLLDSSNNVLQSGPGGTGASIPAFTVAKSAFTSR